MTITNEEADKIAEGRKLQKRQELIEALRDVATFLEKNPDIPTPIFTTMNAYVKDREQVSQIARVGKWEKDVTDRWFYLRRRFNDDLVFEVNVEREMICKKVVKGTRVVPARPAEPEKVVEDFEWVCDESILAGKDHER